MATHNQYEVWTTGDGRRIHLDDMTEAHAKNIIRMALRQRFRGRFRIAVRRLNKENQHARSTRT